MLHQDWKIVNLSKQIDKPNRNITKTIKSKQKDISHLSKLDNNDPETLKHKKTKNIGKIIQKHRLLLKMNQKELAQKLNTKTSVIIEYESGKAIITNNDLLSKIERLLNVKLQGNNIGSQLK